MQGTAVAQKQWAAVINHRLRILSFTKGNK
jgi:hypothetical protein